MSRISTKEKNRTDKNSALGKKVGQTTFIKKKKKILFLQSSLYLSSPLAPQCLYSFSLEFLFPDLSLIELLLA